jgi:pimeloyl-ACP methyl ester carboxylesterase/DNA-binding CsgD family transcriptional regulator
MSDGYHVAYQTLGDGPLDLIYIPSALGHLETYWEEPSCARFLRRLASFSRLTIFDKRGTGMSDRLIGAQTLQERMEDVGAVMRAVGSERAALFGMSEGGSIGALFAATYPAAVSRLVVMGSGAVGWMTPEEAEARIAGVPARWGDGGIIEKGAPSVAGDARIREWTGRLQRRSCTPGSMAALMRMNSSFDVRSALPAIEAPTLVLHRTGDQIYSIDKGRDLAERTPGAQFVELVGTDHIPYFEEPERILGLIEEFITGRRAAPPSHGATNVDAWGSLTPAELRVADLVRQGLTNPHIAERLYVSRDTVKTHISHILTKLGCTTRAQIAVEAAEHRPRVASPV